MLYLNQIKAKLFNPYVTALSKKNKASRDCLNELVITRQNNDLTLTILGILDGMSYTYLSVNLGAVPDNDLGIELGCTSYTPLDSILADKLDPDKIYPTTDIINQRIAEYLLPYSEVLTVPFTEHHAFILKHGHKHLGKEASRVRLTWINFHLESQIMYATDGYSAIGAFVQIPDVKPKENKYSKGFSIPSCLANFLSKTSSMWLDLDFRTDVKNNSWVDLRGVDAYGNAITLGIRNQVVLHQSDYCEIPSLQSVIPDDARLVREIIPYQVLRDIVSESFINDYFESEILPNHKLENLVITFFQNEERMLAMKYILIVDGRVQSESKVVNTFLPCSLGNHKPAYGLEILYKLVLDGVNNSETVLRLLGEATGPSVFNYSGDQSVFGLIMNRRLP